MLRITLLLVQHGDCALLLMLRRSAGQLRTSLEAACAARAARTRPTPLRTCKVRQLQVRQAAACQSAGGDALGPAAALDALAAVDEKGGEVKEVSEGKQSVEPSWSAI